MESEERRLQARIAKLEKRTKFVRDARKLQGIDIAPDVPSAAEILAYNEGLQQWEPSAPGTPGAHALVGASQTASGLTAGHVVRATAPTTFAWQELQWADLAKAGSSLADLATKSAGALDSGNLGVGRMPTGGAWVLASDLNIDGGVLVVDISEGSVGIGTAIPQARLEVESGGASPRTIAILQHTLTRAAGNLYGLEFRDSTNEINAAIVVRNQGPGNNAAQLVFYVADGEGGVGISGATEWMRIDHVGRVGIGTTGPLAQLDVSGAGGSGKGHLRLSNSTAKDALLKFEWNPGSATDAWQLQVVDYRTPTTNLATLMVITSPAGNVGIGVTDPDAKLEVAGTLHFGVPGAVYTWPAGDGADGQFLKTDGAGNLVWAASGVEASDHGALTGLGDDDHAVIYLNVARHDADDHSGLAGKNIVVAGLTIGSVSISEANLTSIKTHVGL